MLDAFEKWINETEKESKHEKLTEEQFDKVLSFFSEPFEVDSLMDARRVSQAIYRTLLLVYADAAYHRELINDYKGDFGMVGFDD